MKVITSREELQLDQSLVKGISLPAGMSVQIKIDADHERGNGFCELLELCIVKDGIHEEMIYVEWVSELIPWEQLPHHVAIDCHLEFSEDEGPDLKYLALLLVNTEEIRVHKIGLEVVVLIRMFGFSGWYGGIVSKFDTEQKAPFLSLIEDLGPTSEPMKKDPQLLFNFAVARLVSM